MHTSKHLWRVFALWYKDSGAQGLARQGNQGVVKTKYRLQSKVWWTGMDKDVDNLCKICHGCQVTSSCDPHDPMSRVLPLGKTAMQIC